LDEEDEGAIYGNNEDKYEHWHTAYARGFPEMAKLEVIFDS
jgi:hypothetical protein